MQVIVITEAFSGHNSIGLLNIRNFVANMPNVFSTTTRDPDNFLLNIIYIRSGLNLSWFPG